jgi:hypothetical protein
MRAAIHWWGQMPVDIARREFMAGLGAAAAWSSVARAQQPAKLPTIGFLGTPSASAWTSWTGAFVERLRELGWIEGRTVRVEYRWAEAHNERFAQIATEFVRLKVDVIVTSGSAGIAVKAGDVDHPDCACCGERPRWARVGHELAAAGW